MTNKRFVIRRAALALIIYPVLIVVAHYYGETYTRLFLPLYKTTVEILAPHFAVKKLDIVKSQDSVKIDALVSNKEKRLIGSKIIPVDAEVTLTTLQGHALQHVILIYTLLIFWLSVSGAAISDWLATLVLSLPVLVIVEIMDVPFVLVGSLQDFLLFHMAPEQLSNSLTVKWMMFLNGGGRLALSISSAMLSIFATSTLLQKYQRYRSSSGFN